MVIWTDRSRDQLKSAYQYWHYRNPIAAKHIVAMIHSVAEMLNSNPFIGHVVTDELYEAVIIGTKYILHYSIKGDDVFILGVYHSRQEASSLN